MRRPVVFAPDDWHSCTEETWRDCDQAVACYSYALNDPRFYWSIPGFGYVKSRPQPYFDTFNAYFADHSLQRFRQAMIDGAARDGLIPVDEPVDREGYRLVALFFADDPSDFNLHWYRKDDDGTWSHKDGWQRPRNTNNRGESILDPRDEPPGGYPVFGSFFYVPLDGIELAEGFPVPPPEQPDTG